VERNRISSLESHGKALKKECCLPDVFCDSGDTPANLLCELSGHFIYYYRAMLCIRGTSHGSVSVCVCVRPSVTSWCSIETAERIELVFGV